MFPIKYLFILLLFALSLNACSPESKDSFENALPPDTDLVLLASEYPASFWAFAELKEQEVPQALNVSTREWRVRLNYREKIWLHLIGEPDSSLFKDARKFSVYEGVQILRKGNTPLYMSQVGNTWLVSRQALAVEKGIYQLLQGHAITSIPNPNKLSWLAREGEGLVYWEEAAEPAVYNGTCLEGDCIRAGTLPKTPSILPDQLLQVLPAHCRGVRFSKAEEAWLAQLPDSRLLVYPKEARKDSELDLLEKTTYLNFDLKHFLAADGSQPWGLDIKGLLLLGANADLLRQCVDRYLAGDVLASRFSPKNESEAMTMEQTPNGTRWLFQKGTAINGYWQPGQNPTSDLLQYVSLPVPVEGDPASNCFHLPELQEILIQSGEQLLAFDESLQLLWKQKLNAKVIGVWEARSVNARKPDQVLVQTTQAFYRYIPGEEASWILLKNFRESVSMPASIVEFEALGGWSAFVPQSDGKTVAFNEEGAFLPYWTDGVETGMPAFSMGYLETAQSDFLVFLDTAGVLKAFDRQAELHFPEILGDTLAASAPQIIDQQGTARIVWLQANGKLKVVNGAGQSFNLGISTSPPIHWFRFEPNETEKPDYLLLDGKHFIRANYQGNAFVVLSKEPVPPGTTDVLLAQSGSILGYWQEGKGRLLLPEDKGFLPFEGKPILIEQAEQYFVIGLENQTLKKYRL